LYNCNTFELVLYEDDIFEITKLDPINFQRAVEYCMNNTRAFAHKFIQNKMHVDFEINNIFNFKFTLVLNRVSNDREIRELNNKVM
jgi:hypothetical protein